MVEIISVHLPKTAGSTFRQVLVQVYGSEQVFCDYFLDGFTERVESKSVNHALELISPQHRVIHGHFPVSKYKEYFPDAKWIIWLRNPVLKLISYYFFEKGIAATDNSPLVRHIQETQMNILEFAELTAIKYWSAPSIISEMKLSDFYFVGIQDFFKEDMEDLKRKLGWPEIEVPVFNENPYPEYQKHLQEMLDDSNLMNDLEHILSAELELYQEALNLRKKRREESKAISVNQHKLELSKREYWLEQIQTDLDRSQSKLQQIQADLERSQSNTTQGKFNPSQYQPLQQEKSKKLLLYTDDFGLGGVAQHNHSLVCGFASLGYSVTLVQSKIHNPQITQQAKLGIQHQWLEYDTVKDFPRTLTDKSEAEKIFTSTKPALIIFSNCGPISNLGAKRVAIELKIPYIIIEGLVEPEIPAWYAPYMDELCEHYRQAQSVISVSTNNLSLLRQLFKLPHNKGEVIHYGRPPQYFTPKKADVRDRLRQYFNIPSDAVVCFTAARIETRKGYHYQLEAIKQLMQTPAWHQLYFVWAGSCIFEPQLETQLKEAVKQLGITDKVKFLGERSDVSDWLEAADIFVLPSQSEGMPLCVMEAMAKGLPVIATAVSGIPEELGDTGKLLPDPKIAPEVTIRELVTAIQTLVVDTELRRNLGQAGKLRAEKMFTEERMLEDTVAVIERTLLVNKDGISPSFTSARLKPQIIVDGFIHQILSPYGNTGGIGRVWQSLLEEWVANGFSQHIVFLDRGKTAPKVPGIRYLDIPLHNYDKPDADHKMLQEVCDREGADLFISTYYTTPISTPSVFMAYDMIPELLGMSLEDPTWREKHHGIRHASSYVSISENTARDLVRYFPEISPDAITVAHCGVGKSFSPASRQEISSFKEKYGISKPYFLLVGWRMAYKNCILFLKAFNKLPNRFDFDVVCLGGNSVLEPEFGEYASGNNVHLLRVSDSELSSAYSGALALVYPSLYEGFGIPIVEAMACGCPVITCPCGSIPEVAGSAALYVNGSDPDELVNVLINVQNLELRSALISAGLEQVKKFSWSKMAVSISSALLRTASKHSHKNTVIEQSEVKVSAKVSKPPQEIPPELFSKYTMGGLIEVSKWYFDDSQPHYTTPIYDKEQIDAFVKDAALKAQKYYGETDIYLYQALDKYPIRNKSVAIMGSQTPWYESICLHYGGKATTIDYHKINSQHPDLKTITIDEYNQNPFQFDIAFSISSFEHDGLGRYGDPLSPDGDFMAMYKMKSVLKPGGLLFLSVPLGKDQIVWNAHRVYGNIRLPHLLWGWEVVEVFGLDPAYNERDNTQGIYQPIFVLRNTEKAPNSLKIVKNTDDSLPEVINTVGTHNQPNREVWLEQTLKKIPPGSRILDAGAGELQYKKFCSHLKYVSQDFGQYDGKGDAVGLQMDTWDQTKLDIVCDITAIPEPDASFDAIMCIEVFEHLPNPLLALKEFSRLLRRGGYLIITAPFCSLTHMAPYHFYSGFNRYFYETNLATYGFEIMELQANGNFFEYMAQEIRRIPYVAQYYVEGEKLSQAESSTLQEMLQLLGRLSYLEGKTTGFQGSTALLHFGCHVWGVKK